MPKRTKKKHTRRQKAKYPALDPVYNPKNRRESIDFDYLDQLSVEELEWLNKFMEEHNGANLDYKNLKNNLHNTKELKKDCTDRVNARNRCLYTIAKINGRLTNEDLPESDIEVGPSDLYEEYLIAKIDGDLDDIDFDED